MKATLTCFSFLLAFVGSLEAQTSDITPTLRADLFGTSNSGVDSALVGNNVTIYPSSAVQDSMYGSTQSTVFLDADSIESPSRPKLLPDNLSLMENGVWSEDGILRKWGFASPLTPEVRKSELSLRRTMLSIHQVSGFVTLALMATTAYFGQKTLDGRWDLSGTHSAFVKATLLSYGLTAIMSIFAPPPIIRRNESSTTTIHKTLAWIHFAGMILNPIIGGMVWKIQRFPTRTVIQNDSAARFHQISAYVTTATFAAAMVVLTF